jgi:hypothetical protein
MRILAFLLLFPFNSIAQDALLEAIYGKWDKLEEYEKADEIEEPEPSYFEEAEVYHWNLGTPDNIPEIEIIYEDSPCRL